MPEAVAEPPKLYKALVHPKVGPTFVQAGEQVVNARSGDTIRPSLEGMQRKADQIGRAIERQFPNYPPGRLEAMLDLVFGFTRLDTKTLTDNEQENPSQYQKELSARIQHNFTHQIVYAGNEHADPAYTDRVYDTVANMTRQIDILKQVQQTQLEVRWAGMRNEVAVTKALLQNGYHVFVPNYMQDTGEINDAQNEVLQLDVKRGIDLIAISPQKKVILIDVKGRKVPDVVLEDDQFVDLTDRTHPTVKKAIERAASGRVVDPPQIYHTTLIFPTEGRSFKPSKLHVSAKTDEEKKGVITNFGALQPHVEGSIIDQLNHLQQTTHLRRKQLF